MNSIGACIVNNKALGTMRTLIVFLIATFLTSCDHKDRGVYKELSPIYGDITVRTSDDNKLRFYSWEDDRSGTASSYTNIAEYIDESGDIVRLEKPIAELITDKKEEFSPGYEVVRIFTTEQQESNYYIIVSHGKSSSGVGCGLIVALQIHDNKLIPVHLFDDKPYISYDYNFFDDKFETMSNEDFLNWSWLCRFDKSTSTLHVRQFDKDGKLTEKYQEYKLK